MRASIGGPAGRAGIADADRRLTGALGGPVVEGDNPLDEAGFFQPTSDVLPPAQFPQFTSQGAAEYQAGGSNPFAPVEGRRYAGAVHADDSYMRLTKTVDLTGSRAAQLQFQLSLNSEAAYDHFIVEAHTVGQDNWTTLPELGGATTTDPPARVQRPGFLLDLHPFLRHYFGGAGLRGRGHERHVELDHAARPTAGSRSPTTCPPSPASRSRCR